VAKQLIGKKIVVNFNSQKFCGIISETEAYTVGDSASHAYSGKSTRNEAMFRRGGITYVYLI
jgi:DNA-3-methyladenine glycosylase